jgi:IclR family KDG regulon transcriptional repressor
MMKCENTVDASADTESHLSSVYNAMRLIKIFSDERYEIGLSELARRLDLPKSSVHRLASDLVESNMLSHNAQSGKYRLGLLMFELASLMTRKQHAGHEDRRPQMATPTMQMPRNRALQIASAES